MRDFTTGHNDLSVMPSILLTNLRSICNKFDELRVLLVMKNPDLVICTETWLTSGFPNEAFDLSGYSCYRTDRFCESGRGGVIVWAKKYLQSNAALFQKFQEAEICCIQTSFPKLIVVGLYLPPGISSTTFRSICDKIRNEIDDFLIEHPHHKLIVAGDFNRYDMTFLTSGFSVRNIVNGPTRLDATLDLIFVDKCLQSHYNESMVCIGPPVGSSDHNVVFVKPKVLEDNQDVRKHVVFDLRESNVIEFERRFVSNNFDGFYSCSDVNEKCNMFYDFIYRALCEIPRNEVLLTNRDAPWMTPLVKLLIDRRWEAYRQRNWVSYNALKGKVKSEIFKAKAAFFKEKSKSVKGLWSYINYERGPSVKSVLTSNLPSSSSDMTNELNDFFCSVMSASSSHLISSDFEDDEWLPQIEPEDVWQLLSHLRPKATGSDDIPTLLYKRSALVLADPLHHLITECLRQRKIPTLWKIADVVPVPKISNASINDCRPISLLPIPAKIIETVILNNLRPKFSNSLGTEQFGIRKGSSTTHAIIAVHDSLTRSFDDPQIGASILMCFDYSKAFDKIKHLNLILRIQEMGMPKGFIVLLKEYLQDRFQRVRFQGHKSNLNRVSSGVPQGSLLGPYLFGLFVSSLRAQSSRCCMVKYVDDVCLTFSIRKSNILEDIADLESEVSNVSQWSQMNGLTLNINKTNGLINYRGNFKEFCNVQSCFPMINFQSHLKFLGIMLDESFGWKRHVEFIEKKCAQRMYILRRMKSVTSDEEFMIIYNSLIRSLIEYACPAFIGISCDGSKRLQNIENRCLKIKGISSSTTLVARRRTMALKLFSSLSAQHTFVAEMSQTQLPSGRLNVPFSRTIVRRNSFLPKMCIVQSGTFCD